MSPLVIGAGATDGVVSAGNWSVARSPLPDDVVWSAM
jgi:hypothetical protein